MSLVHLAAVAISVLETRDTSHTLVCRHPTYLTLAVNTCRCRLKVLSSAAPVPW